MAVPRIRVVDGPRKTSQCGGATYSVEWRLNANQNGFVVQHITVTFGDLFCNDRPRTRPRKVEYYEAWEVRAGRVFAGYRPTPFPKGFRGSDLFRLADSGNRTKGTNKIEGKVKFLANINRNLFKANSVPFAGILPATRRKPPGWTDAGAADHKLEVSWNCCGRRPTEPTITAVPMPKKPKTPSKGSGGVPGHPVERILWRSPAWADLGPRDRRKFRRLRRRLNRLAEFPLTEIRKGIKSYLATIEEQELDYTVGRASRIFVLNRFLFELPRNAPLDQLRVFGGWAIPQDEETADMAFPFVPTEAGNPRLTGRFRGYFGAAYDGLAEFDYLRRTAPPRWR